MMRAFVPSALTASEAATTTSGLGLVAISNSFYVVFLLDSCPHTKFYPNRTKNIEVKKICYRLVLVGWSVKK